MSEPSIKSKYTVQSNLKSDRTITSEKKQSLLRQLFDKFQSNYNKNNIQVIRVYIEKALKEFLSRNDLKVKDIDQVNICLFLILISHILFICLARKENKTIL